MESLCVSLQLKVPDYLSLFTNFKICGQNPMVLPFKWNLLGSSFTKYQGRDLASPPPPPPPASYFWTKLRSKRPKKKFFYTEPPLSQGLDDCSPPPILSQWLDLPLSTICTWIIMFIRILQNKFALLFWWIFFSLAIIKSGSINIDHMTFPTFILYSVTQKLHIINSLERWD